MKISQYLQQEVIKTTIQETLTNRASTFIPAVVALVNEVPKLEECDRKSLMSACLNAVALNLPLSSKLGYVYIIPYNNKGKLQAQLQIGYKGFIQLAMQSGQFKTINVSDVREGELVGINRLTGEYSFTWSSEERESKLVIGYVGFFQLSNGFEKMLYMTKAEIEKHGKKYSMSYKKGFGLWSDEFDTMAKKTIVKLLLSRYAPLTSDMQQAVRVDQAIIQGEEVVYSDNQRQLPEEIASKKEEQWLDEVIDGNVDIDELEQIRDTIDDQEVVNKITKRIDTLKAKNI